MSNCPMNELDLNGMYLIGCDGPHSTDKLKELLKQSIENEEYELSRIYQDEIERRKVT